MDGTHRSVAEAVGWLVTTRTLVAVAVLALALGAGGALAVNMYLRHNEQHRGTAQFQEEQRQFNQQVIAAIQQLGARK